MKAIELKETFANSFSFIFNVEAVFPGTRTLGTLIPHSSYQRYA